MSNVLMSNVYRIAFVQGQGFGWFTPEDWATTPHWARDLVRVLVTVETEEEAKRAFKALPQHWEDIDLRYQDGEWWQRTDMHVPWAPVTTEKLPPSDQPKSLTD